MTLEAVIGVSHRGVLASLTVPSGTTLALLGPNGSGKTTVIEALAGIIPVDSGSATLDESVLFRSEGGRLRVADSRARGIALVTQDAALFPHLSVLDNVAFPKRARGASKAQSRASATEWLERVGAGHLSLRKPRTLSGGQARRVAVARALASEPRLMLLDEPFASLDIEATVAMRSLLRDVLKGRTTLISTHDGLDAIDLADDIAVLDNGVVVEHGPTASTFEKPRTAFTAAMAGLVWLPGIWHQGALVLSDGQRIEASGPGMTTRACAAVALDPRSVKLVPSDTTPAIHDTVTALEPRGDGTLRVRGSLLWADVSIAEASRFLPRVGETVHFGVDVTPHAYAVEN